MGMPEAPDMEVETVDLGPPSGTFALGTLAIGTVTGLVAVECARLLDHSKFVPMELAAGYGIAATSWVSAVMILVGLDEAGKLLRGHR